MNANDTINRLAGRDDLSREELLALRDARRAQAPETERRERNGWVVEINRHVHTHGQSYATAWRAGTDGGFGSGMRVLAGPVSHEEAVAAAEQFLDAPPR